jgi:hypothetical protein
MAISEMIAFMDFSRQRTLNLLELVAKEASAPAILRWRPGPGRAHLGWQLMHIAATDDRHLHMWMLAGEPREPEYVRRFAGGSTPDDDLPGVDEIRRYLGARREEMLAHLRALDESALDRKPNEQARWTYRDWIKVLAWHEAHHQGQGHLTLNLYRAAHAPAR